MAKITSTVQQETPAAAMPSEGKPVPVSFRKSKIVSFQRYAQRVDLLHALLDDAREYSLAEVDAILAQFMKGRVN